MGSAVRNRVPHPKTIDDLFVYLKEEWVKINPDYLKKLVENLLRRVNEVIGRSTRYWTNTVAFMKIVLCHLFYVLHEFSMKI